MQNHYVDAHLHLQDPRLQAERVMSRARKAGVSLLFCNAIQEEDWPAVADLAVVHQEVVAFFGIHPWFSETATTGWQQRLLGGREERGKHAEDEKRQERPPIGRERGEEQDQPREAHH